MYSENDWRYYNSNELYHHGILGQKWGVRRFQNADGSLTSAGKKRYGAATTDQPQQKALTRAEKEYLKKNSEDYSDKTEARNYAFSVVADLLMMNPIGAAYDIKRGIEAASSNAKTARFERERLSNPVDAKTGFHKKSRAMTTKEDLERVNPSVHNFDANTKSNCMLCTTTYDMRKRGYDVTAKTAGAGFDPNKVTDWYPNAKIEIISGDRGTGLGSKGLSGNKRAAKQATDVFMQEALKQGEGARGNIMVSWSGTYGGHSMAYEVSGGQVRILDGQVNKIYSNPHQILDKTTGVLEYARLDNVDFDPEAIKRCCR